MQNEISTFKEGSTMAMIENIVKGTNIRKLFPNIVVGLAMFLVIFLTSYNDEWETTTAYSIALVLSFLAVTILLVRNLFLKERSIVFYSIDIVLIVLFTYSICFLFINFPADYAYYNIKWTLLYATAYFIGRSLINCNHRKLLFKTIFLIAISQSIWSIYQAGEAYFYMGFSFKRLPILLKGGFSNSSMLAFLMAMGSIIGISFWRKEKSILFKVFLILNVVLMILVLFTTTSRAAMLMLALGIAVLFGVKKRYILISAIILFTALLSIKKDSARGRTLIWKVSMQMVSDNPIFGIGLNRFGAEYNNYQSYYFLKQKASEKEILVASNNFYDFNLPIKIWVELGLIGLFLYVLLLFMVKKKVKEHPLIEALLSAFFLFSLFSYPLAQLEISFLVFVLLGTVASLGKETKRTTKDSRFIIKGVLCLLFLYGTYMEVRTIGAIKKWKQYNEYRYTSPAMAVKLFEKIHSELSILPEFLYSHATLLSVNNNTEKAIRLLEECSHRIPTSNLYSYLGINYGKIKKDSLAEYNYSFACNMVPNLFVPKYYLFLFYRDREKKNLAMEMAKIIIDQPIKIKTKKVVYIKEKASIFIKN